MIYVGRSGFAPILGVGTLIYMVDALHRTSGNLFHRRFSMNAKIIATFTIIIGISSWGIAADNSTQSDITIESHGLRIGKPAPGYDDTELTFDRMPSGTSVGLLIKVPQGGLVVFDSDSSKLKSFIDDKGKDLTKSDIKKTEIGLDLPPFEAMPHISKDGKLCRATLTVPSTPTKDATKLTISGEAVMKIATQKKDYSADKVELKKDSKINAGPIPLTITRAGKPEWSGDGNEFAVVLEAKQNLDSILDIQFFDAAGKKIDANRFSTSSSGFTNNVSVTWEYQIKSKVDSAKIVITYWTDMKTVVVPFNMTFGVGF
jgi:hypothetical protein